MPESAPHLIDDTRWDELMKLTGGQASICYQCGSCTANCPWGLVSEETVSIRSFIRDAQLGLPLNKETLWLCTTCAYCEAYCPRGVDISRVILALRQMAWHEEAPPQGFPSLMWSVYWNNNPWSQPPSHRSHWAQGLKLEQFEAKKHEVLLYIGCTSSYDRRDQQIAKAIVQLLRAAGVSFGILMDDEPCCGEAVLSTGHSAYFEDVARKAAAVINDRGTKKMVVISPHCYDVFRNHNQYLDSQIEILHYTTYVARLLEAGLLHLTEPVELKVAYHDPCYLARHNQETTAARQILKAIPKLELIELERSREDTLCCGAGGGRMWLETASGQRFSDLRITEVVDSGAELLATACPFCLTCLEDSARSVDGDQVKVLDIAEIAILSFLPQAQEKQQDG